MSPLKETWYRVAHATDPSGKPCPPRVESRVFTAEPDNKGWRSADLTGADGFAHSVFYATYEPDARGWGAKANGWRRTRREAIEAALAKANDRASSTREALEEAQVYAAAVEALLDREGVTT